MCAHERTAELQSVEGQHGAMRDAAKQPQYHQSERGASTHSEEQNKGAEAGTGERGSVRELLVFQFAVRLVDEVRAHHRAVLAQQPELQRQHTMEHACAWQHGMERGAWRGIMAWRARSRWSLQDATRYAREQGQQ